MIKQILSFNGCIIFLFAAHAFDFSAFKERSMALEFYKITIKTVISVF